MIRRRMFPKAPLDDGGAAVETAAFAAFAFLLLLAGAWLLPIPFVAHARHVVDMPSWDPRVLVWSPFVEK